MRAVDTSTSPRQRSDSDEVTVERLERAIHIVAEMMVKHDMPQLILTIRFLEAERDRLQQSQGDYTERADLAGRNRHAVQSAS